MLEVGKKAPDFELPDQNGEMHKLSDYAGKKVILYFYPKDNTPGCTKQACGFSERYPQFTEKGAVILGVSKDSVASHKKFEEKYKELQPEKYQDTIQHVIQKGNTPAGMHISIMVKEILDFLNIQPGENGFDATLGYGGHTKAMLQCLNGKGHIYATDVDPEESAKTKKRLYKLNATTASISDIKEILADVGTLLAPGGILLYLDEIQYFNKKQQQSLLEFMENGSLTLIASTTENPFFYVYNALLSRSSVFEFKPVPAEEIRPAKCGRRSSL